MASVETAFASRGGEYTLVKTSDGCGKAFWGKPSWNRVRVKCPHCSREH